MNSALFDAPAFCKTLWTWSFTVPIFVDRISEISLVPRPFNSKIEISFSAGVKAQALNFRLPDLRNRGAGNAMTFRRSVYFHVTMSCTEL